MNLKKPKNTGFTLVELLVSVGITAILMVGLSTFFSSTFRNMFMAREQVATGQEEFVVNTILNGKFAHALSVDSGSGCGTDCVVLRNDTDTGDLPFTYVGKATVGSTDRIVFKDFFVFNGKEGTLSSQTASGIENPGGLTVLSTKAYVTAPLEDDIYVCTNPAGPSGCSALGITGLNQPIDITNDDTFLYVTDAGNNRIVKIPTTGGSPELVAGDGFNYPTGIAFYTYGGTDYLFVSDTYNHLVKKVQILGGATTVVAGDGDDEVCDNDGRDHTASFCKLNFPTGLLVADDGTGEALYIADTGNGRVLKVSDPGHPDEFNLEFDSPSADKGIKEINFVFPTGTDTSSTTLDSFGSTGDILRKTGNISKTGNEFTYELWTTLVDDTLNTNQCSPEPCAPTMDKIEVAHPDIFNSTSYKDLYMASDYLTVQSTSDQILDLTSNFSTHQSIGEVVSLTTKVPADTSITFDFSSVDTSAVAGGFHNIDIEFYDETNALLETRNHLIRFGNGELGTPEDTISVEGTYDFPTGLGWNGSSVEVSGTPDYSTDFSNTNYDYVSDFEVRNLDFSEPNPGQILELHFEALEGEDSEGSEIWEENTLNANISG